MLAAQRAPARATAGPGPRLCVLLVAGLVAGCSGGAGGAGNAGPMGLGNADGQGWFGSTMQTTTVATTTPPATADTPGKIDPTDYECPPVEVRNGASAWQIMDKNDGALRYQATLGKLARECKVAPPNLTIRVGIQGRVLLGSKGGPGSLSVPLRVALIAEGPEPKPIWTKLYPVPVAIGEGESQIDFNFVAEDLTVPLPAPNEIEKYVVYVGFDAQAGTVSASKPAPRTVSKPAASAPRPAVAAPSPAAAQTSVPSASTAKSAGSGTSSGTAPASGTRMTGATVPLPSGFSQPAQ